MDEGTRVRLALQRETDRVTASPEMRRRIAARLRRDTSTRRHALVLSVAVVAVAVGSVVWFYGSSDRAVRKDVIGPPPTTAATPLPTPQVVLSAEEAEVAFRCVIEARRGRDLDRALPCMTDRYRSSITDPVQFIGASSPSLERATIVSSSQSGDRIVFDALSYWGSSRGLEFVSEDTVTVVRERGDWLVDGWTQGREAPVGSTTTVSLRFLTLGDTPSCDGGTPTPESFVTVRREVPSEPVIDDLALSVVRELFTGPWTHEGDAAGSFSPGSRVGRVSVSDGVAKLTVNDVALRSDGPCNFSVPSLRGTLTALPGIRDVEISREPPQEPIAPDV